MGLDMTRISNNIQAGYGKYGQVPFDSDSLASTTILKPSSTDKYVFGAFQFEEDSIIDVTADDNYLLDYPSTALTSTGLTIVSTNFTHVAGSVYYCRAKSFTVVSGSGYAYYDYK